MTLVLDAGALVAAERGDRDVAVLIERERRAGRTVTTHGGVIGQVWRGGGRQAALSRLLGGVHVAPLDDALGRRAGVLLARTATRDVIDAAVILLAEDGDEILTSDPRDLAILAAAAHADIEIMQI